jgi:hydroxyacylglutathione hydrolase
MDDDTSDKHLERIPVGRLTANCYLFGLKSSNRGVVIDPGGEPGRLISAVKASGLVITDIILTHGHSDHIAALHDLQEATGAAVAIHAADADFLIGHGPMSSQFGISYRTPDPPDRLLSDGDIIGVGGLQLSIIHTPGHTPGSICLLSGDGILFTGDTLVRRGIGTTLMPGSSRRQLIESIRARLLPLPDDTAVYPGHGRPTTIGEERRENHYLVASRA